ncbi:MAG: hypothetical protein R3E12_16145 [Candidatus Eisenbacteria bacterium]
MLLCIRAVTADQDGQVRGAEHAELSGGFLFDAVLTLIRLTHPPTSLDRSAT